MVATVKPVGIEQEDMHIQGLKLRTLRKFVCRRLSDKKKKTHGTVAGCHQMAVISLKDLCDRVGEGMVALIQEGDS